MVWCGLLTVLGRDHRRITAAGTKKSPPETAGGSYVYSVTLTAAVDEGGNQRKGVTEW